MAARQLVLATPTYLLGYAYTSQRQELNVNGNTLFHCYTITSLESKITKRETEQNATKHHKISTTGKCGNGTLR